MTSGPTKPQVSELFPSLPVQILIPYRSKYTYARADCGGGPNDAPIPVRGHFVWRAPTEIPACWLKRSPSEGRSSGGVEGREGVISPSSFSSSSSSLSSPEYPGSEGVSPPALLQPPERHSEAASFASVPATFHYRSNWPPISLHPGVR
jgi:hypothetical protein